MRSFADADGDGIGDFKGLAQKLDYLQDLGVTALWVLPFYPSPLRDDGYDISDYRRVNSAYGSLRDFRTFISAAHSRGLRVITELVMNHTSDEHPWFQRARSAAPGSEHRNYYVWTDDPTKYEEARIIFKDFESSNWSWDAKAGAYYWHRFYSHQPDLNFDNPAVQKEMLDAVDFWLEAGVDGLRLDAVPYLFERDGTSCENLPETHAFLRKLRRQIDRKFSGRMLLAEANQWPEDAAAYFGKGDECHTAFHFPLMPRLFMSIRMEDRFPIIDILRQTPEIPDNAQWMIFLRNHDELTLEMVTDEERDYMYRVYANDPQARINVGIRRRLAPLLGNNRRRIELMSGLLLSMPGTPVIYYGDEIGMGDNIYLGDRNGVRTPMQWSPDRNAGFSRANPQRLFLPTIIDPEFHYEAVNVEAQQANPSSLLWWMKRLIALRKRFRAFGRGSIEFLYPDNPKVLAFFRRLDDECVLVVVNLSRFTQAAELDLSAHRGSIPVELFGRTLFPPIGELPYFLTLGPHSFYWFSIEQPDEPPSQQPRAVPNVSITSAAWEDCLRAGKRRQLESALQSYLRDRRWFAAKARKVRSLEIEDVLAMGRASGNQAYLVLVHVAFYDAEPETYALPLGFATGAAERGLSAEHPESVVARLQARHARGTVYECLVAEEYRDSLLAAIARPRGALKEARGVVATARTSAFRRIAAKGADSQSQVMNAEQSNTSIRYGDRFILKLYRRVEHGENPELEVTRQLTEVARFGATAQLAGYIEFRRGKSGATTLAVLQEFVPNQGDAWTHALEALGAYFERTAAGDQDSASSSRPPRSALDLLGEEIPPHVHETIGPFVQYAELLGQRTAELHRALAIETNDAAFRPEPFTMMTQRSLYQSLRTSAKDALRLLQHQARSLPEPARSLAAQVLAREDELLAVLEQPLKRRIASLRTRRHGDFHLGQVLFTGKDFVIIDFEGEPAKSLSERRLKRSPLTDVAGMLRSYEYAAQTAAVHAAEAEGLAEPSDAHLQRAEFWSSWCGAAFLRGYLAAVPPELVPQERTHLRELLRAFSLDKAFYEVTYELNNRPQLAAIPLRGVLRVSGLDVGLK